jgi:hypothetical protein
MLRAYVTLTTTITSTVSKWYREEQHVGYVQSVIGEPVSQRCKETRVGDPRSTTGENEGTDDVQGSPSNGSCLKYAVDTADFSSQT